MVAVAAERQDSKATDYAAAVEAPRKWLAAILAAADAKRCSQCGSRRHHLICYV